jgi:hypothetical protein
VSGSSCSDLGDELLGLLPVGEQLDGLLGVRTDDAVDEHGRRVHRPGTKPEDRGLHAVGVVPWRPIGRVEVSRARLKRERARSTTKRAALRAALWCVRLGGC